MNAEVTIPSIVKVRMAETEAKPSIPGWRSLSRMISSMVVTGEKYDPKSPVVIELKRLAAKAHQNMLDMQPQREVA